MTTRPSECVGPKCGAPATAVSPSIATDHPRRLSPGVGDVSERQRLELTGIGAGRPRHAVLADPGVFLEQLEDVAGSGFDRRQTWFETLRARDADSRADMWSAIALLMIAWGIAIYWVSGQ